MPAAQVASFASASSSRVEAALAAVVSLVARDRGIDVELALEGEVVPVDPRVLAADVDQQAIAEHGPWLPGMVREALTEPITRRRAA